MEKTYLPHEQRVIDEKLEVKVLLCKTEERAAALNSFIIGGSETYNNLSDDQKKDLSQQLVWMYMSISGLQNYVKMLDLRISKF